MRLLVSNTLRIGVLASVGIVFVGLVLMLAEQSTGYGCVLSNLSCLLVRASYPRSLAGLFSGLALAKPFAIIEFGVIVLLATPVLRVVASIALFAAEKDRIFMMITLTVLAILLISFFLVPLIPFLNA
jgi:uncharacterized membrane protein